MRVRVLSAVTAVRQSPLNAMRWNLELACGHEVWVSAKRKPKRKRQECHPCTAAIGADK